MVDFTNPGILGDATYFRKYYEVSRYLDVVVIINICYMNVTFLPSAICIRIVFFFSVDINEPWQVS